MKRTDINKLEPQAYKAMLGLEGYLGTIQISKSLKHLIKLRASQINKCAFCINMHSKEALKDGETDQRIFLLNAWRETELYTTQERAALAMTEEITHISHAGLTAKTYQEAQEFFNDNEIAQIIMVITTINAWNRIAVSTQMELGN
ncbi:MAG: carboxymuconolactone decarboxylase family protein [Bacteroidia bacterium]|nr:carboxymuconolactone decarboxylase family protein [Bacteroidia bacterium]